MACASFVSSPPGQVRVDSVEANESISKWVTFWVTFENTGSSPINFVKYSLNYSVPANSPVLKQVKMPGMFPGCTDITVGFNLDYGHVYTLPAECPSDKAFHYQLVQPGTVDVNLNFTWSTVGKQYTTEIWAKFAFQSA
jgi:hypothetical protein